MPPIRHGYKPLNLGSLPQPSSKAKVKYSWEMSERDRLRLEARQKLTFQYRMLTGRTRAAVPWSNIWKAVSNHRLVLVGYPTYKIQDPIHLLMSELRRLVDRVHEGTCRFVRISDAEFCEMACQRQKAIEAGQIKVRPPRKKRSDAGDVRGCHLNPKTRTRTRWRGKVICSPAWVEDDEIENEVGGGEMETVDPDPIEDW